MKKFTLFIASLFLTIGAMAQTPVLELTSEQIGTSYPLQLSDENAQKVFGLTDLTVVIKMNTAAMSGRMALFCTSDPNTAANTSAMPTNSAYVAYGTSGENLSYLASCRTGDRYSSGSVPANSEDVVLAYVLNPTNTNFKAYINNTKVMDRDFGTYEIATPAMVKADHANAKIYIGGGKTSEGAREIFNGTIKGVKVYDGVLTAEQIANAMGNTAAKNALGEALTNATTLFGTISVGEGVGKYSSSIAGYAEEFAQIQAYYNAIIESTPIDEINAKTARVGEIVNSFSLNMPEAGKYYRLKGNSGNYIDASSLYDKNSGQMSMKSAGECNLAGTIFYLDNESHLLNYATGTYTRNTREIGAVGDATKSVWAFSESTRTRGKYVLTDNATAGSKNLHDNGGTRADKCSSVCGAAHDWTLEEVTELPVTVTAAGYATLYAPVALTVPTGVTAHTVTLEGEYAVLSESLDVIPAYTGVVLYSKTATTYTFAVTTSEPFAGENALEGTVAATYVADDAYVLGIVDEKVGFYTATKNQNAGAAFLNNHHKAYLPKPVGAENIASYSFRFQGGATGIDEITDNRVQSTVIYDLTGRRVENITAPGIYVVNGKKVLVK